MQQFMQKGAGGFKSKTLAGNRLEKKNKTLVTEQEEAAATEEQKEDPEV